MKGWIGIGRETEVGVATPCDLFSCLTVIYYSGKRYCGHGFYGLEPRTPAA